MTRLGFLLGDKVSEGPAGTQYSMEEPEARQVLFFFISQRAGLYDEICIERMRDRLDGLSGFLLSLSLDKGDVVFGFFWP